ncbi:NlpC/P60 family protein [Methylobrevis albus]|uniref:C40 family peptidase n=1 Tax=Methylobrevis albus TaxID=2793297 RepID=A0A931I1M5_9HYPH|nr:NlpC/P60 family protein [Methylobrevis albus]MBH0237601.1 C40 family peptidase [Methylobrevis albus]
MPPLGPPTRAAIVAETFGWLGTPYRHQASCKGAGCDCLGLVRGVWRAVIGPEPAAAPPYTPDWAEAGADTLAAAAALHLVPVAAEAMRPGDVLLFRWRAGLPAKHAAILVDVDRFVHAHAGAAVAGAALSPWWRRRLAGVFAFPGVTG